MILTRSFTPSRVLPLLYRYSCYRSDVARILSTVLSTILSTTLSTTLSRVHSVRCLSGRLVGHSVRQVGPIDSFCEVDGEADTDQERQPGDAQRAAAFPPDLQAGARVCRVGGGRVSQNISLCHDAQFNARSNDVENGPLANFTTTAFSSPPGSPAVRRRFRWCICHTTPPVRTRSITVSLNR